MGSGNQAVAAEAQITIACCPTHARWSAAGSLDPGSRIGSQTNYALLLLGHQHDRAKAQPFSRARPHSDLCSELIAQGALSGILYILEEEVHVIQFVEEPVVILKVE